MDAILIISNKDLMKIRSNLDKEFKCRIHDGIKVIKAFRVSARGYSNNQTPLDIAIMW